MERITQQYLEDRTAVTNSMLRGDIHLRTQGRNGYTGLDLYDGSSMVKTLTIGTKREVYTYLGAMIDALEIVGR